ncbi:MAG: hypothetical protein JWO82_4237, partial [Akkermansiaceae bacterium]|nr:hypothetical protein [Akkermansiaceae bacterium]
MAIGLGVAYGDTIPDWLTATGRHYKDVEVVEIKPDGISIRHQDGVARIPFDELTPAQRDTYHLTEEGRDGYEKRKSEQARQAAEAARQSPPVSPSTPQPGDHATGAPASVHYITVDEIKRAWAAALTLPRTLDKNYKSLMRSRDEALRAIASGSRDREAEKKAAQYNK